MILNITNGEYFNNYIKRINSGLFIPFNEAMIDGETTKCIFSNEFIKIRSRVHNVSLNEYISKLYNINDSKYLKSFEEIVLWFGYDTFCIMNLITILGYLDSINYNGKVFLNVIDDHTLEIIENKMVIDIVGMNKIYNDVFINKIHTTIDNQYIDKGIESYLEFKNGNDIVSKFIKENINNDDNYLLYEGIKIGKDLGLSDTIIKKMIDKIRN